MTWRSRRTAPARPTSAPFVIASLALVVTLTSPSPTPAAAQDIAEPSVRIVDQTTFVPADGVFHLVVDVEAPAPPPAPTDTGAAAGEPVSPPQPWLSVTFHSRLETEAAMGRRSGQALNRLPPLPLNRAPRTEAGWIELTIPIRSSSSFDDQERVLLPLPGVYPVTVELRDEAGVLATVGTHLVRLPIETADEPTEPTDGPVEVSLVLDVTTAEGLTVTDLTHLLAAHPTVPLTIVLDQGAVNQLRGDAQASRDLAAALDGRPVLVTPTLDLDPSAMVEIGQRDLYLAAARADRQAIVELGLQPAEGTALLSSPLTAGGIDLLAELGVRSALDVGDGGTGGGILAGDGGSGDERSGDGGSGDGPEVQVIRPDRDLNRILAGDGQPPPLEAGPVRANRALSRLSLRRQLDDGAVVVGGPDLGVDPLPAVDAFLRSLSQPGAPQPVPLAAVSGGPALRLAERPQQDLAPAAEVVDRIRRLLEAYESSYVSRGTEPIDYLQRLAGALTVQRNPEDRLRALTLIVGQLEEDLGVIHIHDPQPVTLAARSSPIPLVIENRGADPRRVVLRFRGDRVLSADDGRRIVVQPGTSSIDVEVEARSLGASPLEVTVWSGDESVLLSEARFEIRSTAVPGLGLLISLSALAMLGAWWVVDHRRRRRREGGETAEPAPSTV